MGGENLIKAVAVIGAGAAGNKFPKADDDPARISVAVPRLTRVVYKAPSQLPH